MAQIAHFDIHYDRFLNEAGEVEQPLPEFAKDTQTLLSLYKNMVYTRVYDQRAIALQRTGQMGTYASILGQEAIGAGVGHAMQRQDILAPSYREGGVQFFRGVKPSELFLYWGGDERGMNFNESRQDFPVAIPIASQACHAVGAAYAMRLRKQPAVVVCMLGDGGTSKGDFYESMNVAGSMQLPVIFVVSNNQWAISVRRTDQSSCDTLAQKAIAGGMPGQQIDGNDVIAVRHYVSSALERARTGDGPSLIEAMTYRLGDHTTADDAKRYRSQEEVDLQHKKEPVGRLRNYLIANNLWNDDKEQALIAKCEEQIETEVEIYLATEVQPAKSMFDHLYATLPKSLQWQRAQLPGEE
ncbi:MAG: pyruvate dehydrogenase (acetyl-transferring) E1 component subunit alpha [Chromatiales bacterium]|nr:pyruvate dehydrogenase (acetyl-transferring) E1 component subunit alpha [Chromatiales bacterium]